jgi:hypothetical protein
MLREMLLGYNVVGATGNGLLVGIENLLLRRRVGLGK